MVTLNGDGRGVRQVNAIAAQEGGAADEAAAATRQQG